MARRQQSDDASGCLAFVGLGLLLVVFFFAVAWPVYVGSWVAERAGAARPSDARTIVQVLFEAAYLVTLLSVGAGFWLRRRGSRRAARVTQSRRARQQDAEATVARLERSATIREDEIRTLESTRNLLGRSSPDVDLAALTGWADVVEPGERVVGAGSALLTAPRVAHRGGPKVQTAIEAGCYLVTDRRIRFRGTSREETWALARITRVERVVSGRTSRFLFTLSGRKSVSGLSTDGVLAEVLDAHLAVARGGGEAVGEAKKKLDAATRTATRDLERVRDELRLARAVNAQA